MRIFYDQVIFCKFKIPKAMIHLGIFQTFSNIDVFKSVISFSIYTLALPFFFLIGRHIFMKLLIKDFDHIGRLLAVCGLDVIKEKYVMH